MPHNIEEALLESVPGRLVKAAFMVALCMPIGCYLLHPCIWGFRWIFYRSCHNALSIIFPTWEYHIQGTMHRPLYMIEHLHISDKRGPLTSQGCCKGSFAARGGAQREGKRSLEASQASLPRTPQGDYRPLDPCLTAWYCRSCNSPAYQAGSGLQAGR